MWRFVEGVGDDCVVAGDCSVLTHSQARLSFRIVDETEDKPGYVGPRGRDRGVE